MATKQLFVIGKDYCVLEKLENGYWIAHYPLNIGILKHHFSNKKDREKMLSQAEVIGGVEKTVDYLQKEKSTLKHFKGIDRMKWYRIKENPIKGWKLASDFIANQEIIDEYFNDMFGGLLPDIIDIVALSNIHKEKKLNKMLLVGPTNIGKTEALENMSFIETESDEFNKAIEAVSGLSKERSLDFMSSGLIHIDDVQEFSDKIKNTKRTVKLKVMNKGKIEHPCNFLMASTTDGSKLASEGKEWHNRILYLEIPDNGKNVPDSELYQEDSEKYLKHTRHVLRKMIKEAFEQEPNQQKLKALQDKYSLAHTSDVSEVANNVLSEIFKSDQIKKFQNGLYGVRGKVGLKRELIALFSHAFVDKPKDLNAQANHLYNKLINAKSSGCINNEKYTDVFYFRDEYQEQIAVAQKTSIKDEFE